MHNYFTWISASRQDANSPNANHPLGAAKQRKDGKMFKKFLGFLLLTLVQVYDARAAAVAPARACCASKVNTCGIYSDISAYIQWANGVNVATALQYCSSWCAAKNYTYSYGSILYLSGCAMSACVCASTTNYKLEFDCTGCSGTWYKLTGSGYWSASGNTNSEMTTFTSYGCTATKCSEGTWKTNTGSRIASLNPSYCTGGSCEPYLYVSAKCAVGYYGTLDSSWVAARFVSQYNSYYTQCTSCPSYKTGVYGTTASVGTTTSTGCYIPTGTTGLTDTYGTYKAGANCPWN